MLALVLSLWYRFVGKLVPGMVGGIGMMVRVHGGDFESGNWTDSFEVSLDRELLDPLAEKGDYFCHFIGLLGLDLNP